MFEVGVDYEFTIQTFTYVYFSTLDVVSQLGGLWSTIKLLMRILLPFMILKFMFAFAQMIQRKATQKVRITRIKDIKKQSKLIKVEIKQKMEANKDNEEVIKECQAEMCMLDKDSPEFMQFYRMVA